MVPPVANTTMFGRLPGDLAPLCALLTVAATEHAIASATRRAVRWSACIDMIDLAAALGHTVAVALRQTGHLTSQEPYATTLCRQSDTGPCSRPSSGRRDGRDPAARGNRCRRTAGS